VLGISTIKDANLNLIYMGRALRTMLIAPDAARRDAAQARFKLMREKLMINLSDARKRMYRPQTIARYEALQADLTKSLETMERAAAMIQREALGTTTAAQFITSLEYTAIIGKADDGLVDLVTIKEKAAAESLAQARAQAEASKRLALMLLVAGVVIAVLMGVLIGLTIQRPNDKLRQSVEDLAGGKVDEAIPHTDYPNEIGVMARALGVLQGIYRQANAQHWVKATVADISAALQQSEDLRTLAQAAVSKVATAVGAGHGAFYFGDGDRRYSLLASYGYRERKHLSSSFAVGEGLVGQCAMEKSPITLTAPKDYIRINSGLGEGPPACISVMPVIMGERVLGVLEMASFQTFSEREKSLMDALLPVLATSLEILDRNVKTKELLAATQEQAERMEKQAAQLEEQTVEMEAQQAELLETENWFRSIIESAPDGMLVADDAGKILLTNPMVEAIFGYEPGELIGGQIDQLVPVAVRGSHAAKREQFSAEGRSRSMGKGSRLAGIGKDGKEVAVHVTLSPLPARGGRGKCVSVSVRKIDA
jgi:PAS domain S-box-containing protein